MSKAKFLNTNRHGHVSKHHTRCSQHVPECNALYEGQQRRRDLLPVSPTFPIHIRSSSLRARMQLGIEELISNVAHSNVISRPKQWYTHCMHVPPSPLSFCGTTLLLLYQRPYMASRLSPFASAASRIHPLLTAYFCYDQLVLGAAAAAEILIP